MGCGCGTCFDAVENKIGGVFERYGRFVANHPIKIITIGVLVNLLLGIGLVRIDYEIDVIRVYTPINSQASKDSKKINDIFPDLSGSNFISYQMPDLGRQADVIVRPNTGNVLDVTFLLELQYLHDTLFTITTVDQNGNIVSLNDTCAHNFGQCSIDGDIFLDPEFAANVASNTVPYPIFIHSTKGSVYYEQLIGGAVVVQNILQSAEMVILRVNLRTDSEYYKDTSKRWQDSFLKEIQNYESNHFQIRYIHSDSLSEELDDNVLGDITLFTITFTLMITYACIATMTARCDCVGQRWNLGFGGVIAAGLAILSAFGFVSACGVEFVSIVAAVPFLIISIGVDDMFLLMSGITATDYSQDMPTRIGHTMRTSGVSITITSLTDLLAFAAGSSSTFISIRNFCIYSGIAVIFCYINQATIFLSCIALNEKRTEGNLHFVTCRKVQTKEKLQEDKTNSNCVICCCSGRKPTKQSETESLLDKIPRWLIPRLVLPKPMKVVIVCVFCVYLGISIWGITQMEQGLVLKNLVLDTSYYFKYREWQDKYFLEGNAVSLVFDSPLTYSAASTQLQIQNLLTKIKAESTVQDNFEINILAEYEKAVGIFNDTSEIAFVNGLQIFLTNTRNTHFQNDVVIDDSTKSITVLRVHLLSESLKDSQEQGKFMLRMRELASESSLSVFAFSPAFIFSEQFIAILPQTLQTVGVAIGMVFIVTCIFMPHPLLLVYVTFTVAMITAGIFGFLPFLGLTLSSITMIHIIMSIGFSVDFAAHICHGYMIAPGKDRNERVENGIIRSGAPIFHGAVSSILGVVVLVFAKSFILYSFFQVMSLVITFGILHALFLLPVILSLIGPSRQRDTVSMGSASRQRDTLSMGFASRQRDTLSMGSASRERDILSIGSASRQRDTLSMGSASRQRDTLSMGSASRQRDTLSMGSASRQRDTLTMGFENRVSITPPPDYD